MSSEVGQQLLRLNQDFYRRFARPFSDTRNPQHLSQPGWQRLLNWLPAHGSLLDAGCGNGRLAHLLDLTGRPFVYVGVDATAELLVEARSHASGLQHVRASFVLADLALPGWQQYLPQPAYTAVALLAVLHHLPGWRLRQQVMASLAALLEPGGLLAISTWQFMNSARLRRKIVPWEAVGLTPDQVEEGDYLLDWRRGGYGLRYCHLVDEDEVLHLAAATGLAVQEMFRAAGDLNLLAALEVA